MQRRKFSREFKVEAEGLPERHLSRQLRLAYLAPEVLKRLTCGREVSAVSLYDLCFLARETWQQQAERGCGQERGRAGAAPARRPALCGAGE